MKTYSEKLRDPRWQKKRLEILQRDEFTCQKCLDDKTTLHVHHRRYYKDCEPWDYEDWNFVTLCETCHEDEQMAWRDALEWLADCLCHRGYFVMDIGRLGSIVGNAPGNSKYFLDLIGFLVENKEAYELLSTRFCESVSARSTTGLGPSTPARQASE